MSVFLASPLPTVVDTVADLATPKAKTGNGKVITTIGHRSVGDNGAASYVYHRTGRSGVTIGKVNIAGPGADDYFSLLVVDECKSKQFDCVGDGSTNDRAAVAAMDSAATAEGGVQLTMTLGTYLISTSLTITNHVVFHQGARFKIASGATLTLSGGFTAEDDQYVFEVVSGGAVVVAKVLAVTPNHFGATTASSNIKPYYDVAQATAVASNVVLLIPSGQYTSSETITTSAVSNLVIKGASATKATLYFTAGNWVFSSVTNLIIDGLSITGSLQNLSGILIDSGSINCTVSNCNISNFTQPSDPSQTRALVHFIGVTGGATCVGCTFSGTGAVTATDIIFHNCRDIVAANNQCLSDNGDGIFTYNDMGASITHQRGVLSGNMIRGKQRHGIMGSYGSLVYSDLAISGNVIHDCKSNGIYYNPGNEPYSLDVGRMSITGNTITNCGGEYAGDGGGNSGIYIGGHLGGTITGNAIINSGYYPDGTLRGVGRGRGIIIASASNWTISGNTIRGCAAPGIENNVGLICKNILINGNTLIDNGAELYEANIVLGNYDITEDVEVSISNNLIISETVDSHGILLFSGSGATYPTSNSLQIKGNDFQGMKLGTDRAGIRWAHERYASTEIYYNRFINYDMAVWSQNDLYNPDQDWAFGFAVRMDNNTFTRVTVPFSLKTITYSAVGKNNTFIDCTPNFGQTIIPASANNGFLDGYYVTQLPARKCRQGDRFLPYYPGLAAEAQWLNTAPPPAPVAFTNTSGNNLTATGHGLTQYNRVRLAGGSLPAPLTPGDYFVATVPDANNFTVHRNFNPLPLNLTGTGSGTFQKLDNDPTWLSDNWNPLLLKPALVSKWSGANQSTLDQQARQNVTWEGTAAYSTPPEDKGPGYSFVLNGTNNGLEVAIPAYTESDAFTLCAFVKTSDVTGLTKVLFSNFDLTNGWEFSLSGDATYFFDGTSNIDIISLPVEADTWIHIALVFNGTDSGVWANGVRKSTFTMNWVGTPPNILSIGWRQAGNQFYLPGEIFDVRLYQTALTTGQISSIYQGPTSGYLEAPVYGLDVDCNMLRPVAASRKNLATDQKTGLKNVFNYSDSTISDGTTDARAAILLADADGPVHLPPGVYAIASNMTLTNRIVLDPGASLKPANTVVVTLNGGYEAAESENPFDTSASGSFTIAKVFYDTGSLGAGTRTFNFTSGNGVHQKVVATNSIALAFTAKVAGYYTAIVEIDTPTPPTITYDTTVVGTAPTIDTADNAKTIIPLFFDGSTWYHV